jgi:hypothetical protein
MTEEQEQRELPNGPDSKPDPGTLEDKELERELTISAAGRGRMRLTRFLQLLFERRRRDRA